MFIYGYTKEIEIARVEVVDRDRMAAPSIHI